MLSWDVPKSQNSIICPSICYQYWLDLRLFSTKILIMMACIQVTLYIHTYKLVILFHQFPTAGKTRNCEQQCQCASCKNKTSCRWVNVHNLNFVFSLIQQGLKSLDRDSISSGVLITMVNVCDVNLYGHPHPEHYHLELRDCLNDL